MKDRKIIHLDMDAFYASIEERDDPSLRGKAVIVGSPPDTRGVVSTCNYIARTYGVHSAMSSAEAYRKCPNAIFITPHFKKYVKASALVHKIMAEYTDRIEFVSLDEGYMDVTGSELLFGSARDIALEIQKRVFETVGTTCSVGVGYSMLSAKCASEENKPNGFFVINDPSEFCALMRERPVGDLYGIGAKTAQRLTAMGIKTIGQLAMATPDRLYSLGPHSIDLLNHARGIDNRQVIPDAPPKSIGREITFEKDTLDRTFLSDTLLLLASDVSFRLYTKNYWGKTVTLKIKFSDMKSITRSYTGDYIRSSDKIFKTVTSILDNQALPKPVRLIGVTVSNLSDTYCQQLSFDKEVGANQKSALLGDTILQIKKEFGISSLKTARELYVEDTCPYKKG